MRMSAAFLLTLASAVPALADDWPQWMGPERDNVWRETGLLERFPKGGPKVVWRSPVAGGYAGPAVVGDRVYVTDFVKTGEGGGENFDRKGVPGTERVLCLDAKTGSEVWKHEYPVVYTISYSAGPRCTPLVHEGKVYTLGAEGNLICFGAADGKVVWQKDLKKEYGTTAPLWGYAAHPLIDGRKLITLAGGKGSQVVALDKETGKELWRSLDTPEAGQGYVPPSIIEAGGTRQLIILKPDALCAVDPETGKPYWSVPYEADNGSIIMTPVHAAGHLFAGGFNGRNLMVKLAADEPAAETVWKDKPRHGISPINVQPYAEGDLIYGIDANGTLTAFKVPGGERLWTTTQPVGRRPANSGTAFLVRQGEEGDRVWMFADNGDLVLGTVTPEAFTELDRAHVIDPTNTAFNRDVVWCAPAYAGRRMYVRNDKECVC
ncbi:MAG TPA: PQQ-binding-like beta-propeller repeat protein, partial [Planctomycetaceae bacterium]